MLNSDPSLPCPLTVPQIMNDPCNYISQVSFLLDCSSFGQWEIREQKEETIWTIPSPFYLNQIGTGVTSKDDLIYFMISNSWLAVPSMILLSARDPQFCIYYYHSSLSLSSHSVVVASSSAYLLVASSPTTSRCLASEILHHLYNQ